MHKVTSSDRVRHVLCDEVGMGKTIEAIIRIQSDCPNPLIKVGVFVPTHLQYQWKQELLSRLPEQKVNLNDKPSEKFGFTKPRVFSL